MVTSDLLSITDFAIVTPDPRNHFDFTKKLYFNRKRYFKLRRQQNVAKLAKLSQQTGKVYKLRRQFVYKIRREIQIEGL